MADDMESVTQRFEADMTAYIFGVKEGADEARKFAEDNEAAKAAAGGLRDKITEAAAALKIYRDEAGKLRDASGSVITASEAQAMALKHIRDQALEAAWAMRELDKYERGGLLSRLLSFGKGFGGGFGSVLSKLPYIGTAFEGLAGGGASDAAGAAGTAGGSGPAGAIGMGAGISAIVAAAPAIAAELTGLVSGFAAAGAGAGAFYLLAHPAISNLQADVKSLDSANQALGIAQQKYLIDPTKANATALQNAQVKYHAIFNQMGQDAGPAAAGVLKLHDEYVKLSNAFQPEAFKVFNGLLQVANNVLPAVAPFAKTFADSISGLLGKLSGFTASKGFKDWLDQFHALEGPAIGAIGAGVGHLVTNFAKLFTMMSGKDVANAINIAFSVVDGALIALVGFVHYTMVTWDALTTAWDKSTVAIRNGGHVIAGIFDAVRYVAAAMGHDVAGWFDRIRHDAAQWAGDVRHDTDLVISFFASLPGRILSAVGDLGSLLLNAGRSVISGLISGIENAVPGLHSVLSWVSSLIPSWKGPLEADAQMLVPHGTAIMQGLIRGIASQLPALRSQLAAVSGVIPAAAGSAGLGAASLGPAGGSATHNFNVNVNAHGALGQLYESPEFQQYLYRALQEAVLRYQVNNPGNGLSSAWGTR